MSDPMFVICRSASDKLGPGAERGYICKLCDLPLQVTEPGRIQIATLGAKPICNKCGYALVQKLPKNQIEFAGANPAAEADAKSYGVDPLTALAIVARLKR